MVMMLKMNTLNARRTKVGAAIAMLSAALVAGGDASAAVVAPLTTPSGASATITVTIHVTTSLGSSSDDDTRTVAVAGTGSAAFLPNVPPFNAAQLNSLNLGFANTTFTFQLFCIPIFGCQTLNVTVSNLQFTLTEANCAAITPATGAVAFTDAAFHATGSYSTTGLATSSGAIDGDSSGSFTARVTNPASGTVRFDLLAIATQTFVVPQDQLPTGVTALSFTVATNLANTTLSGPFSSSAESFDADGDGVLDGCDSCTDIDGDGFGDPGFPHNTCAPDNCPDASNPSQSDHDADGVGDACDCIADCHPPGGGDGAVDVDDLIAVILGWGACPGKGLCPPDVAPFTPAGVGNGFVDVDDLIAVILGWGPCP